jgi:hypothetical protein
MITEDPDYEVLATRIVASNIQKIVPTTFADAMFQLWEKGILSPVVWCFVNQHRETIEKAIVHKNDFNYNYFGLKTLEKSYLFRVDGKLVEGYRECARLTWRYGTTYYWGAALLPKARRRHVHAVYALCRLAAPLGLRRTDGYRGGRSFIELTASEPAAVAPAAAAG